VQQVWMDRAIHNNREFIRPAAMLSMLGVLLLVTLVKVSLVHSLHGPEDVPERHEFAGFKKCGTNSECPSNLCCLLGGSRYAIPSCSSFQQKDEQCRVNAEMLTTNLTYPDNSQIEVKDIHLILCPCADGLSCDPKRGICS